MLKPGQIVAQVIREKLGHEMLLEQLDAENKALVIEAINEVGDECIRRLRADGYEVKGIYFDRTG